jgi:hypothetical protein
MGIIERRDIMESLKNYHKDAKLTRSNGGGDTIYTLKYRGGHKEIEGYRIDFESFVKGLIGRFEHAIDILGDEAWDEFGVILDPLVRDAQRQLNEVTNLIEKEIGPIMVDVAENDIYPFYRGEPLGVMLDTAGNTSKAASEPDTEAISTEQG